MLKSLDVFGYSFQMTHKRKSSFKSNAGLFLTFIWLLGTSVVAFISLEEIYSKDKPQVYQTTIVEPSPEELNLTKTNFFFAGALETSDTKYYIDESVYTMQLEQVTAVRNKNDVYEFSSTPLSLKKCSEVNTDLMDNIFSDIAVNHMYCADPEENHVMKGIFGNLSFKLFRVRVFKCNPATSKVLCKSQEEIKEKLHNGYFGFVLSDSTYNPSSPLQPFRKFKGDYFTTVSDGVFKLLLTRFNHTVSVTDLGIFFSDIKATSDYAVASFEEKESSSEENLLLQLEFRLNNRLLQFNRRYTKIQRAAADIGAISNAVFILLKTVCTPYQKMSYINSMIGRKSTKQEKKLKITKFNKTVSESFNSFKQDRIKIEASQKLPISYFLCYYCKKQKFITLLRQEQAILEKQDIKFFIRLKNEISLLKHMVLSKSQNQFLKSVCLENVISPSLNEETVFEEKEMNKRELKVFLKPENSEDKHFLSAFKQGLW